MKSSYWWYPRIGDVRVELKATTLMDMVILWLSQPEAGTISVSTNCITSNERLRRGSRMHRIRLLLPLQQLLLRMGSRRFRQLHFEVLWLLVSLMG